MGKSSWRSPRAASVDESESSEPRLGGRLRGACCGFCAWLASAGPAHALSCGESVGNLWDGHVEGRGTVAWGEAEYH